MNARRVLIGTALAAAACGAPDADTERSVDLPVYTVGEPVLEIGAVDGPEAYVFAALESVIRLGNGEIAVSDAGATRISVFGRDGTYLRAWGSQGEGPEEFRSLARLYPLAPDSLMAAERFGNTLVVYADDGTLARRLPATDLSRDSTFALDSWLYGRFWIEGGLTAERRAGAKAVVDGLPLPRAGTGFRSARLAREGRLWVREPDPTGSSVTWTRLDGSGAPTHSVDLPDAFRPTDIDGDDLLGVWRGENDVPFVRAYTLQPTEARRPVPAWLLGQEAAATLEVPPDEQELIALMSSSIRSMATAQEIHYGTHSSYTPRVEELERFEEPEGLGVHFVSGDSRGWGAVFTHPSLDRLCALAYGANVPPGWTPGMVVCGPAAGSAGSAGGA